MKQLMRTVFVTRLWITVLAAIVLGALFGWLFPHAGAATEPIGTAWIQLIRMLIAPIVFCTIVTGIVSAGDLIGVGRIGAKALVYFESVTTIALAAGLVVMNVVGPGRGLDADPSTLHLTGNAAMYAGTASGSHWYDFLVAIIPTTFFSAFTEGNVLQVLLVAILFAIVLRTLGETGRPILTGIERVTEVFFGMVRIVLYLAPFGAFAAMAYAVGAFGFHTLAHLGEFVGLFWLTGIAFMLLVFGGVARLCGLRILQLYAYFRDELLITLGTANYEAVMPQLIVKLQRLGAPRKIVGLVVPSGYAFNGDGVCLYLGFAALFIAQAFGIDLSIGQQILLLAVFLITSKGSAGVAGSGFIILAATLSTVHTVPVVGIVLILGVDRFLSTMRGLVSLGGQITGSLLVAKWEGELDVGQARRELDRRSPTTPAPSTPVAV